MHTSGAPAPSAPSAFLKLPGAAQGPGAPLELGPEDRFVDYEGEIAMVVGAPARDLDVDRAAACIAGLMLANDVSARDVPLAQITLGKGRRGFCPLGPWLVTVEELDLGRVSFAVEVNGAPRQSATTATMIHSFAEILASYSRATALEPGDVVLTGTPGGVGIGQRPPSFLEPGDEIVVSSPQLGSLRTPVVAAGRLAGTDTDRLAGSDS
jgi:2-keto-4-pentenoate hydratase/2-oxohepta-3-ene-1,7-dioic acid hydratase in catechol pathway